MFLLTYLGILQNNLLVLRIHNDLLLGFFRESKDCSSKFRTKHITNTVLCLLRNFLGQSLCGE